MNEWKRWVCIGVLLSLTGAMLPGCGDGEQVDPGFVLIINDAHNELDPQKMSWMHDIRLTREMFDPLVRMDYGEMEIRPAVAEQWEVSEDKRTYTFHLRDDAKWSNGDPVTAQDFVYAWKRAMLPDTGAQYKNLMYYIEGARAFHDWRERQLARFNEQAGNGTARALWAQTQQKFDALVGIRAPDERKLVVTLEKPTPYFLQLAAFVTFVPVHRESVEAATTLNSETAMRTVDGGYWGTAEQVVSNGPYHLADYEFKKYVRLERNPHYWNTEAVKEPVITERIASGAENARLTYDKGGAHFWPAVPSSGGMASKLIRSGRDDVHTQEIAGTYFYNFNCRETLPDGSDNPLADARVRRALSLAIDRETIVQRVTRLDQPIARSFVPTGVLPDYEPPVDAGITYDPEKASALLAEAGYPNGDGLSGLSITYNTSGSHGDIAQTVQEVWKRELGVLVALDPVPGPTFSERLNNGNFTIARAAWIGDYADATTWLEKMSTESVNNDCAWSNAEFDRLLEEASGETDHERRLARLQEAEKILLREQPMALIYQYKSVYMWDPSRVKGLEPNNWSRWNLSQVELVE